MKFKYNIFKLSKGFVFVILVCTVDKTHDSPFGLCSEGGLVRQVHVRLEEVYSM
jgi:hypothetical protein